MNTGFGGLPPTYRRAKKAPACGPPSFGMFGASQDRTQDLFFPPTVGSYNPERLPEPTSPLPFLVQACSKLPGYFENISHRLQGNESAVAKCNSRIDAVYYFLQINHEKQTTVSNECLRLLGAISEMLNNRPTVAAQPISPLLERPAPLASTRPQHPVQLPAPAPRSAPHNTVPVVVVTACNGGAQTRWSCLHATM